MTKAASIPRFPLLLRLPHSALQHLLHRLQLPLNLLPLTRLKVTPLTSYLNDLLRTEILDEAFRRMLCIFLGATDALAVREEGCAEGVKVGEKESLGVVARVMGLCLSGVVE